MKGLYHIFNRTNYFILRCFKTRYIHLITILFVFFHENIFCQDQIKSSSSFRWVQCPNCPFPTTDTAFMRSNQLVYGYLMVPENRQKENSRKLQLSVLFFKSTSKKTSNPPLIILHGGPGGNIVGDLPWQYEELRKSRDIIAIDQRGSGTSEPSFSPELNKEIFDILANDCTEADEIKLRTKIAQKAKDKLLAQGIDLTAYSSTEIASDINDLCTLLGYKFYDLWGSSYGTRIALTIMKNYPEKIRSVILESPLPPNVKTFENINNNFRNSINSLFDKCDKDPECRNSYPELRQDFIDAIKGVERDPLIIPMSDKTRYPNGRFVINSQDMLLGLQQALYGKAIYPIIPLLIEELKHRNISALSNFVESMADGINNLNYGLYYTVICKECMPFNSLQRFEDSAKASWGGLTFYKDEFNICNIWNQNLPDSKDSQAITSKIPVLILSGELDPMAPPKNAEITSATLSSSFSYVFQNTGHFVSSEPYAVELMNKFLKDPLKKPDTKRFIRTSDIKFATDIHINNGVSFLAKNLSPGKKTIVYKIWLTVAFLLLLVQLILSARNLWIAKKVSYLGAKLFYALSALNAVLSIFFIIKLVLAILKVRSENYFILSFGLPQKYSYLLLIPYLILAVLLIQLILPSLKNSNGIKKLHAFFIIPYLIFIFYFNLFY